MFYRLMAGRLPFDVSGLPLLDAAQQILRADVLPLGSIDSAFAGPIEHVAKRAMSPDRERRYPSAAELAVDLRACLEGRAPAVNLPADTPRGQLLVTESADRRSVAIGLPNGTVVVLDSTSATQLAVMSGDGTRLERLAFDRDGRLAIGWASGRVDLIGPFDTPSFMGPTLRAP
jgi:hypothetical protein